MNIFNFHIYNAFNDVLVYLLDKRAKELLARVVVRMSYNVLGILYIQ